MLFAMAFVSMFIIGGLSGIWMASTPVDVYIHDTYIIVAHFHYVVFAGSVLGIFGAIYHWFPKMFGRMMNETLGKIHFVGTFVFTNGVFYMMHQLGVAGLMRRTADPYVYESYAHLQPLNQFISYCAFGLLFWQIFFVVNLFHSFWFGKRASRNPWKANSLEWGSALAAGPRQLRPAGGGVPRALRVRAPGGGRGLLAPGAARCRHTDARRRRGPRLSRTHEAGQGRRTTSRDDPREHHLRAVTGRTCSRS